VAVFESRYDAKINRRKIREWVNQVIS
jgi:hypothetical protein